MHALFRENAPALLREAEAPAAPRESSGFKATIPMGLSVGPKGRLVTSEIEDLPTHHRVRAGRACQRQWRDCSQTDEVILLRESAQISVTAGGNDLFRLLTVPRWSIYDCQRRQFRLSGETGKPKGLPPCGPPSPEGEGFWEAGHFTGSLPLQGKVDSPENACVVPGKTEEVVPFPQ